MFIILNIPLIFWYNDVMRSLCTFGCLALFVGSAFITPSEANVLARAEQARSQVQTTVRGALLSGKVPDARDITSASDILRRIAKSESASQAVSTVLKRGESVDDLRTVLSSSADVLTSTLPTPSRVVSRAVRSVTRQPVVTSKQWKSLLGAKNDPALQKALEEIDFASRKHDPRLCLTLDPSTTDRTSFVSPTIGDLLALCLAKVSANPERCTAIDPLTGATLRSICEGELVRSA